MIWGVDRGKVSEERLSSIGLSCWGGGTNAKGMTYHVYSDDKSFDVELNQKDFDNIEKVYKKFKNDIRIKKLKKINDQGTGTKI